MTTLTGITTVLAALAPAAQNDVVTSAECTQSLFEGAQPRRYVSAEPMPSWGAPLAARFSKLRTLPDGWAGCGSRAPCQRTLFKAHRALTVAFAGIDAPALPEVVPVADGGLQFEWHSADYDLEVYFGPDDSVSAIAEDIASGVETEKEGNAAFDLFFGSIRRLAQGRGNARHASVPEKREQFEFAA